MSFHPTDTGRGLRPILLASVCAAALTALAPAAAAQQQHATHRAGGNYGRVEFPISCSPQAQERFNQAVDQAVAMLHSFHFPATGQAFAALAEAEPDCAMAWWGWRSASA
jgi:hypothetical protein